MEDWRRCEREEKRSNGSSLTTGSPEPSRAERRRRARSDLGSVDDRPSVRSLLRFASHRESGDHREGCEETNKGTNATALHVEQLAQRAPRHAPRSERTTTRTRRTVEPRCSRSGPLRFSCAPRLGAKRRKTSHGAADSQRAELRRSERRQKNKKAAPRSLEPRAKEGARPCLSVRVCVVRRACLCAITTSRAESSQSYFHMEPVRPVFRQMQFATVCIFALHTPARPRPALSFSLFCFLPAMPLLFGCLASFSPFDLYTRLMEAPAFTALLWPTDVRNFCTLYQIPCNHQPVMSRAPIAMSFLAGVFVRPTLAL